MPWVRRCTEGPELERVVAALTEGPSELVRWLPDRDGRPVAVGFELGEFDLRLEEYESFFVAAAPAGLDSD